MYLALSITELIRFNKKCDIYMSYIGANIFAFCGVTEYYAAVHYCVLLLGISTVYGYCFRICD